MIKHVCWRHNGARGRVAVFLNGHGYFIMKSTGGKNLPVEFLFPVLDASLPGWRKKAEEEFRKNNRPWRVDTRRGTSGCRDFCTRRLEDEMLREVKTTARIHVSMFWKVSFIEGYLGELAPILARLREFYPIAEAYRVEDGLWEGELDGASFEIRVFDAELQGFRSVDDTPSLGLCNEDSDPAEDSLPKVEII
jgi:hypothetical protein